jgi:chromate reductase
MSISNSDRRIRVLGISGSLREGSFNTALLRAAQEVVPEGTEIAIFDIKDIPLYNGDIEAQEGIPQTVAAFHKAIRESDGVLFATPEYNHSVSGVLKNAIDWASRDKGEGSLINKPVTMIGAGGGSGTARAQNHLENILHETRSLVMVKPGVLVSAPREKFDGNGRLVDQATRKVLRDHLERFEEWIELVGARSTERVHAMAR